MKKIFAFVTTLLASGCSGGVSLDMAYDDAYLEAYCPTDEPAVQLRDGLAELAELGFGTRISKTSSAARSWDRSIALPKEWNSFSVSKKAWVLRHELVHARQRNDWGNARFNTRYIKGSTRWAIEMQGMRQVVIDLACQHSQEFTYQYKDLILHELRHSYLMSGSLVRMADDVLTDTIEDYLQK